MVSNEPKTSNSRQEIIYEGKKYEIEISIDADDITLRPIGGDEPVPNPEPSPDDLEKPTEGTIKPGGWGASNDPMTWSVVPMRDFPKLFKVVDNKNKNVATHFTTGDTAQKFINWFRTHPFPPKPPSPSPEPEPEPGPSPAPTGKTVTKDGVEVPYEGTGKIEYKFRNNDRDDGKRMDFNDLKGGEYRNAAILGYFALENVPNDEVSGKFSAMPHSGDGARTECYDMGVKNKTGATRIRYEQKHPDYTGALATGDKGKPLGPKFLGYLFARKTQPNGNVLCEIWQDQGDNEGTKPANQWVKLFSYEDSKYKFSDYKDGHQITIRVDGKNIVEEMKLKWLCLVELKA